MTEAQKQFEAWIKDNHIVPPLQSTNPIWWAWKHQQQRIDELESKLKLAVDTLEEITEQLEAYSAEFAYTPLSQIEVK